MPEAALVRTVGGVTGGVLVLGRTAARAGYQAVAWPGAVVALRWGRRQL